MVASEDGVMSSENGVVGVWAHRRALLLCPRCRVDVPYCCHVVIVRRCRMWLSRTINNDK